MPRFAIRPRRYHDQADAIADVLQHAKDSGVDIDHGRNPNGKYSLLAWAHCEILRLRAKCGEQAPVRRTKVIVGPRPAAEAKEVRVEETQGEV